MNTGLAPYCMLHALVNFYIISHQPTHAARKRYVFIFFERRSAVFCMNFAAALYLVRRVFQRIST